MDLLLLFCALYVVLYTSPKLYTTKELLYNIGYTEQVKAHVVHSGCSVRGAKRNLVPPLLTLANRTRCVMERVERNVLDWRP